MRKITLLLVAMVAASLLASGAALALNVIQCPHFERCYGTSGDDQLDGTNRFNTMEARAGDDLMYGRGDLDVLYGDAGKDRLFGNAGMDNLHAGSGKDEIDGGLGPDSYYLDSDNWGHDTIVDTPVIRDDHLDDTNVLYVGQDARREVNISVPLVIHLKSDDGPLPEVEGPTSTFNWAGDVIDRVYNKSSGDDEIVGNDAMNEISSVSGADTVSGGKGNDLIYVDDFDDDDTVRCGSGEDEVHANSGDTISADCEVVHRFQTP